jgi:hypothetical protein
MDKKKSINNIQDLGFSADSRHCIGWQPIPVSIFRIILFLIIFYLFIVKNCLFLGKISIFRNILLFSASGYRLAADTFSRQPIPSDFQKVHKSAFCP